MIFHNLQKNSNPIVISTLLITLAVLVSVSPTSVFAGTTISIENNGESSSNEVTLERTQEETITQTNEGSVDNSVTEDQNTGGNEADGNSGEVEIGTGDISTQTTITTDLNHSEAEAPCCETGGIDATISGNGAYSTNTVDITSAQTFTTNITNVANIKNSIDGSANTGRNTANRNGGDVLIVTGDINVHDRIINRSINTAWVRSSCCETSDLSIKIFGNGTGSVNTITYDEAFSENVNIENLANIINSKTRDDNTGDNHADDNLGDVTIRTGDITDNTEIDNDVNQSVIENPCNCLADIPPVTIPPSDPDKPADPGKDKDPNSGDGNGRRHGGGSDNDDDDDSQVLPATGESWFFFALLANLAMFMFGVYLRMRSGRAPGNSFSFGV